MAKEVTKEGAFPDSGIKVVSHALNPQEVFSTYRFMDGQYDEAMSILNSGIDHSPKNENLWLMKLDLLKIQNDQVRFEEVAVDYAGTFGKLAPAWRDIENVDTTTESESEIDVELKPTSLTKSTIAEYIDTINSANGGKIVIDMSSIHSTDRDGVIALNSCLRKAISKDSQIIIRFGEGFTKGLMENCIKVKSGFREIWDLAFLLMKVQDMAEDFDDFSLEYAGAFGQSPPDFETLFKSLKPASTNKKTVKRERVAPITGSYALSSDLTLFSESDAQRIQELASSGKLLLDMRSCRKISIASASRLSSAIDKVGKNVVMIGTNHMIRSALHFAEFIPTKHITFQEAAH